MLKEHTQVALKRRMPSLGLEPGGNRHDEHPRF